LQRLKKITGVIKHKISDIVATFSGFVKKSRNKIRYRNLSDLINPAFGNKDKLLAYNKSRVTGPEPCVCHAPSRSLYFDIHGKATACCFNRANVLGKFPENSISEIIDGGKRRFLQTELCRQNFMYGCQHCHKLIEAGNFDGAESRLYDNLKDQAYVPSEIIFELDNTCNLECAMCHGEFSSSIAKRQGLDKIKHPYSPEFLKQLEAYTPSLKVAKFLGGEPFLISIYYEIWDLIIKLNPKCKINLQTNGTVFNDRVKSYLEKGNFYVGISVDSLQKERFESIRKNAVFENVMDNIDRFIEISKKKNNYVNISVCPMQQNWEEIPAIVEYCNRKNVFVYFNTVYTSGFAISEMPEDKLLEILEFYKSVKIEGTGIIAKRNIRFFENLTSNIESWYAAKEEASRPYRRRHLWNTHMLELKMLGKLKNHENLSPVITEVFKPLEKEFYLSDNDLISLENIKEEDVVQSAENESVEEIRKRILLFIETGRFNAK